jgi:hypothetical protein
MKDCIEIFWYRKMESMYAYKPKISQREDVLGAAIWIGKEECGLLGVHVRQI